MNQLIFYKKYFKNGCLALVLACSLFHNAIGIGEEGESYQKPTNQFLELIGEDVIWESLIHRGISKEIDPLLREIASKEAPGFIGYHGSSQKFRVIQDVVRISIEQILGIPIREDFQFLRIPGDLDLNIDSVADFFSRHDEISNEGPLRAKQLLSLNFSIYGGYDKKSSCTISYFAGDDRHDDRIDIVMMLSRFFEQIGANAKDAKQYAKAVKSHVGYLETEEGILLQIFDMSHQEDGMAPYQLVDKFGYAAKGKGFIIDDFIPSHYLEKKVAEYPQLRLVMSNYSTLSPNSTLVIKRYDTVQPSKVALWEEEVRVLMRAMPVDAAKKEKFKAQLLQAWVQNR